MITLDVREDINQGREPLSKILSTASQLKPHQKLMIIAPFEPVPLYHVLGSQGFDHDATPRGDGDWEVVFKRKGEASDQPESDPTSPEIHGNNEAETHEIDARGWEPPQPLIKILETLGNLPQGGTLQARTDRRPIHLFPHLQERGFEATSEEQEDGSYITRIRHKQ